MEVKIIKSIRGKDLLVVNGYKFNFHKKLKTSEETCWKCTNRKCKACIYTLGVSSAIFVTKTSSEHCHLADISTLNRQTVSAVCKRKAVDDISEKPSKIIRMALKENLPATLTTRDVEYVRKNMYNSRRKLIPALPKNINDVHEILNSIDVKTSRGEQFLFINCVLNNIIVFTCLSNLEAVGKTQRIYVDGTFDYCAKYFTQMFTIHGFLHGHYIPLMVCLLPNKKSETYERLFLLVQDKCSKININFDFKEIVCDFEMAIHKAVRKVWPSTQIIGCRFHLAQAWFRKIKTIGLVVEYNDASSDIGRWLHLTFGLTYLDPNEVGDCVAFELFENRPNDMRLEKYADYLIENYVDEESLFPPTIWAKNSSDLTRTTNACEAFHRTFNDSFYKEHPNIITFLEKLNEFQIETYIKLQSCHLKHFVRDPKIRNRQKFIENLIEKYKNSEIDRTHFLSCISFKCVKF